MKALLIFFTFISLAICTAARCSYGCYCYNDDNCEYYCYGAQCQQQIPLGSRCGGYSLHPRECGSIYWCDPSSWTCQFQKNYGEWCTYSYSCLSGYCDPSSNTCRYRTLYSWQLYILVPILFSLTFFTILIILIIVRRRRQQTFVRYPNQYVVLPPGTPYSYQNSRVVAEEPPPSYPGPNYAQGAKPYQG